MEAGDLHGIMSHALRPTSSSHETPRRRSSRPVSMVRAGSSSSSSLGESTPMSSVYGSSAGAATNQQASSSSSSAAASSMLGAVPSKSIYSAHVGQAQKDGTLVVQAHTFALAAENASKNSKFREASARHLAAHDYFHSALKSSSWDYDPATADALGMLASYHESKSKEMRRLGRARESSTVTSSQAASSAIEAGSSAIETTSAPSSSASTSSASASTSGTPKKINLKQRAQSYREDIFWIAGWENARALCRSRAPIRETTASDGSRVRRCFSANGGRRTRWQRKQFFWARF
mmetsp:Transcript_13586/g.23399  ORF Transcript_13586/g.23399 Transcript_13586/m.23399 type:complete len:292 (-) Transcript_13586:692-1567(-)